MRLSLLALVSAFAAVSASNRPCHSRLTPSKLESLITAEA